MAGAGGGGDVGSMFESPRESLKGSLGARVRRGVRWGGTSGTSFLVETSAGDLLSIPWMSVRSSLARGCGASVSEDRNVSLCDVSLTRSDIPRTYGEKTRQ